ncbi:hypothetical protein NECAME_16490 [Necator americanus]|uniref:Uncharacterized protein n=1 Tax=Necator americanus TaxID=51031 RepID=W2TYH3_NECAM|nr:hypothetical protein NECAME_16490 [Necator americanus]ETN86077.1 hypothetical protein NECAME_16490 [Necator americanus]
MTNRNNACNSHSAFLGFRRSALSGDGKQILSILSVIQEKPAPKMADAWLSCLFAYLSTRYRRLREEGTMMQAKQPGRD